MATLRAEPSGARCACCWHRSPTAGIHELRGATSRNASESDDSRTAGVEIWWAEQPLTTSHGCRANNDGIGVARRGPFVSLGRGMRQMEGDEELNGCLLN